MNAEERSPQSESNLYMGWIYENYPVDDEKLDSLCMDVFVRNRGAFEQIHAMLYPLLFNYMRLFSLDERTIDQMLLDDFMHCWKNWQFSSGEMLKISILKRIRCKIAVNLLIREKAVMGIYAVEQMGVTVVDLRLLADDFLQQYLTLSCEALRLINNIAVF